MKKPLLLIAIWILYSIPAFSQKDTLISFSKVYDIPNKSSEEIYKRIKKYFAVHSDDLVLYEERVASEDKKWLYGRADWAGKTSQGYVSENTEEKRVRGRCIFLFNGALYDCLQVMIASADVIIKYKDNKLKIGVKNIDYCHCNNGTPPFKKKIKGCKPEGHLEELLSCNICKTTREELFQFINISCSDVMKNIYEYVSIERKDVW